MSLNDIINSGIATLSAEIITLPVCTLKTCYQTDNTTSSIKELTKKIYSSHGIRGFYKASFPAIGGQIISTSSKYFLYNFYKSKMHNYTENLEIQDQRSQIYRNFYSNMLCGWASGVSSTIMTHPLDFFKVKMQSSLSDSKHISITKEFKSNGLRVVYRGYSKSFLKVSVGSILFFPLTDLMRNYTDNIILASMSSAIISTIIMHPLDYLKVNHFKWK